MKEGVEPKSIDRWNTTNNEVYTCQILDRFQRVTSRHYYEKYYRDLRI